MTKRQVYELTDANDGMAYIVAKDEAEARDLFRDIHSEEVHVRELPPDEVLHVKRADDVTAEECGWSEKAMTAYGWATEHWHSHILATRGLHE
jgi:hypothetical protein